MHYAEFIRTVERNAPDRLDQKKAEKAIRATLATLSERLAPALASDLGAQLPGEARAMLASGARSAEEFDAKDFLERVAAREQCAPSDALHHVRAVIEALRQAVTGRELERVRAQLPESYDALFALPAAAGNPRATATTRTPRRSFHRASAPAVRARSARSGSAVRAISVLHVDGAFPAVARSAAAGAWHVAACAAR